MQTELELSTDIDQVEEWAARNGVQAGIKPRLANGAVTGWIVSTSLDDGFLLRLRWYEKTRTDQGPGSVVSFADFRRTTRL